MKATNQPCHIPSEAMAPAIGAIGHVQIFQKLLLESSLRPGDRVVDMTLGNGHDALALLSLIGPTGHLYGFDIQPQAVETTRQRLTEQGYDNFTLFCESHDRLSDCLSESVQGFLFNLGYLPKGDKSLTTTWPTTEKALSQAMKHLLPNGFIGVMTYPGHDSGREEDQALSAYFQTLSQQDYQVAQTQFLNQQNNPPKLYWLTRRLKK